MTTNAYCLNYLTHLDEDEDAGSDSDGSTGGDGGGASDYLERITSRRYE